METDPIVAFIAGEPGLAERLLAEHRPDAHGRCRTCSRPQAGAVRFPCSTRALAEQALELSS